MNVKSILFSFALMICFTAMSIPTAQAQVANSNASVCKTCQPWLSSINVVDFPFSCKTKVFTVNYGKNSICTDMGWNWFSSDPSAQYSFANSNGQCRIRFSGPGVYQVCVTRDVGFDADNSGTIDPFTEVCVVMECTTVSVCQ